MNTGNDKNHLQNTNPKENPDMGLVIAKLLKISNPSFFLFINLTFIVSSLIDPSELVILTFNCKVTLNVEISC